MKILVVGAGPLPYENEGIVNAGGLRTAQFLEELKERHHVSLFVVENKEYKGIKQKKKKTGEKNTYTHFTISKQSPSLKKELRHRIQVFQPDVILGVNTFPCFLASQCIPKDIPFWADINGWGMAEMQAQAHSMNSNAFLMRGYEMEQKILRRADKISTVSSAQRFATFGELAFVGRLSKDNFRHSFVEVVENSCLPLQEREKRKKENVFRGKVFPKDAIALVWIGGFNAWADENTLFTALEKAMSQNKNIHFLCTGKDLKGIDEQRFPRFRQCVENSRFAKRIHLLGWLPSNEVPSLLHECDIGINVDIKCPETEFGARNRINEFLRFSLPVITTEGAEISNIIGESNAGITCPSGDAEYLAKSICFLASSKEEQKAMKKAGERLKKERFSARITQRPIKEWLTNPQRAPDKGRSVSFSQRIGIFSAGIAYYKQRGLHAFLQKCLQKIK